MSTVLTTLKLWGIRLWFTCIIMTFFVGAWNVYHITRAAMKLDHWELAFVPHD